MGENVLEEANRTISERDGSNEDGNRIEVADGNDDEDLQLKELEEGADKYDVFNLEVDFGRKISLKAGFIFPNVKVLRTVVQQLAIKTNMTSILFTTIQRGLIIFLCRSV